MRPPVTAVTPSHRTRAPPATRSRSATGDQRASRSMAARAARTAPRLRPVKRAPASGSRVKACTTRTLRSTSVASPARAASASLDSRWAARMRRRRRATTTASGGATARAASPRVRSTASTTTTIPASVSTSGTSTVNQATIESSTRATSPVSRVTRSPDRCRSWNGRASPSMRPNTASRRSAPTRSAVAAVRYVTRYPTSAATPTSPIPATAATAASPAGPSWSSPASGPPSGRPPMALSTASFNGHGRARSSRVSTRINPDANDRLPRYGRRNPRNDRRAPDPVIRASPAGPWPGTPPPPWPPAGGPHRPPRPRWPGRGCPELPS
jgi:hypothetical protein